MRTEELITSLAADLRPVRRVRHPAVSTALWVAIVAAVVGAAVLVFGPRHDLAERMATGFERQQLLAALATGLLAGFAAFQLALPDRDRRWALLPLPAALGWLATMGWGCLLDVQRLGMDGLALSTSFACLGWIAGIGTPLALAMLWLARHAAPLRPAPVAALGGLSAAALASIGLSLVHHLDAAVMVLAWHGMAVALVMILSAAIGPSLMRRSLAAA